MKPRKTRSTALVLATLVASILAGPASAQFSEVDPATLDLTLGAGDMVSEMVSITIFPLCIRPIDVDVVASDAGALVSNTTGIVLNGCGGDTSSFDVQITGTGAPQAFDLQFVDAEFGGVLDLIPVTIGVVPEPAPLCLLAVGLATIVARTRDPKSGPAPHLPARSVRL